MADFFYIFDNLPVGACAAVCISKGFPPIKRNQDRRKTVDNIRMQPVKEDSVCLHHEPLDWRLAHNPFNQVGPQERLSTVECKCRCGIFL